MLSLTRGSQLPTNGTQALRCPSFVVNHTCFRIGHCFRHHFFDLDFSDARLLKLLGVKEFQSQVVPLGTMAASAEKAQRVAEKVPSSVGVRASSEWEQRRLRHQSRARRHPTPQVQKVDEVRRIRTESEQFVHLHSRSEFPNGDRNSLRVSPGPRLKLVENASPSMYAQEMALLRPPPKTRSTPENAKNGARKLMLRAWLAPFEKTKWNTHRVVQILFANLRARDRSRDYTRKSR